ncbi:hypothetical protein J6590_081520 [Homalodisca vitripennis]|nr:hypothetical protein J6590_081520 [Homalodisca vitripennis]
MEHYIIQLLITACSLVCVTSASGHHSSCNNTIINCFKTLNGGKYAGNVFTIPQLVLYKEFTAMLCSSSFLESHNANTLDMTFELLGGKIIIYQNCKYLTEIEFNIGYEWFEGYFTIELGGVSLTCYANYFKHKCIGFYCCHEKGLIDHFYILVCSKSTSLKYIEEAVGAVDTILDTCGVPDVDNLCNISC